MKATRCLALSRSIRAEDSMILIVIMKNDLIEKRYSKADLDVL